MILKVTLLEHTEPLIEIKFERADDLVLKKYEGDSEDESEPVVTKKISPVGSPVTTKKTPSPLQKKKIASIFVGNCY